MATIRQLASDALDIYRQHGFVTLAAETLRFMAGIIDPPNTLADPATRASPERYHRTSQLRNELAIVSARRPINDLDFAVEIPFKELPAEPASEPVAVLIHAFYVDLMPQILSLVANIPCPFDVFISTDTEEKRAQVLSLCAPFKFRRLDVRVVINRGRDIAPKLVAFREVYDKYEVFLHLHTKLSPHGGAALRPWRDHLLQNLIGSRANCRSILKMLDNPRVGIVFPQHFFAIRGILNWGYDYEIAQRLMARLGIAIDKDLTLEFPSGSMFWGKSAAIRPLLALNLQIEDFAEERGQHDGTLAHAIERTILMIAESAGFEWLKVCESAQYPLANTLMPASTREDLEAARLKVFVPCLSRAESGMRTTERAIPEVRQLLSYPSLVERPRITLLIPTVNPRQTFGGVATGLKIYKEIAGALQDDYDCRIVTTDAPIEADGYSAVSDHVPKPLEPDLDRTPRTVVDAYFRKYGRLTVRKNEVFIATAWWTAQIANELRGDQQRYFGCRNKFIYLIQDNEPYFYGWSSKWALAEETYKNPAETIAIINSQELYNVMNRRGFADISVIPYSISAKISAGLRPMPREREILVYGRPSVSRNAFEILSDGLLLWQQRHPTVAAEWRVVSLGEQYPSSLVRNIQNFHIGGKVSLEDYADHLNRASVGIALMLSPHPSYPPLEMAEAGLTTITNSFEGKDLRRQFPNIISLDRLTADALAVALHEAVKVSEPMIGHIRPRCAPQRSAAAFIPYDPARIAELVRGARL